MTIISAIVPARKASRVPPIAAMRDVATEGRPHSGRRVLIGIAITVLGVLALFAGLFADQGIQFVGLGAFIVFIGVFVLGPAVARPLSDWIGWPAARLRGITGALARDNAMRNPKRTSATAAALMIGVALVGFITIFAASAKESINAQVDEGFKADYVISTGSGFGAAFGGFSPQLATDISQLPQVGASSPLRFNQAEFDGSSGFFAGVDPRSANELFNLKVEDGKDRRPRPAQQHRHLARRPPTTSTGASGAGCPDEVPERHDAAHGQDDLPQRQQGRPGRLRACRSRPSASTTRPSSISTCSSSSRPA